jgi:hypothetical protein
MNRRNFLFAGSTVFLSPTFVFAQSNVILDFIRTGAKYVQYEILTHPTASAAQKSAWQASAGSAMRTAMTTARAGGAAALMGELLVPLLATTAVVALAGTALWFSVGPDGQAQLIEMFQNLASDAIGGLTNGQIGVLNQNGQSTAYLVRTSPTPLIGAASALAGWSLQANTPDSMWFRYSKSLGSTSSVASGSALVASLAPAALNTPVRTVLGDTRLNANPASSTNTVNEAFQRVLNASKPVGVSASSGSLSAWLATLPSTSQQQARDSITWSSLKLPLPATHPLDQWDGLTDPFASPSFVVTTPNTGGTPPVDWGVFNPPDLTPPQPKAWWDAWDDGVKNLLPKIPPHSVSCPTPSFDLWGTQVTMTKHCAPLAQIKPNLRLVETIAAGLAALFVIMGA